MDSSGKRPLLADQEITNAAFGAARLNIRTNADPSNFSSAPTTGKFRRFSSPVNSPIDEHSQSPHQSRTFQSSSWDRRYQSIIDRWRRTSNWDRFYSNLYRYYMSKGIWATLLGRIFNLLTMLFVVGFTTFLIGCLDHEHISERVRLSDAILDGCPVLGWFHKISLLIFACFWLGQVLRTVKEYRSLVEMHEFYLHILRLTDDDLNSIQWEAILAKVQEVHASVFANDPNAPQSSTLSIVNRIMRQDNYLIALFNKNILDLRAPVPHWIPLIGNHQLLSQVMQWNLKICMMDYVFGEIDQGGEISVKPVFLRDGNRLQHIAELRKRFIYMGILNLLLAPFTLVFLSVYFLFKYGEELHKNPTQLGARSYSPLARWKFRDFNELPHLLQFRLYSSYDKAMEYMGQFTSEKLAIVAKFISYVAGSIALSLTVLSLLDDEILLHFQITQGRSTLWYLGLFSVIWSASRAFVPDPHHIQRPEELLREVIGYTHFFPREWKQHGLSSIKVTRDFGQYFDYRILLFVHELMSVAVAPFILIFQLPDCSPQILDFFRQFTVHVDGVGNVCTYAMFEFRMFNQSRGLGGNINDVERNASVPAGDDGQYDDKLKTSMMNFKQSYRNWEPRNPNDSRLLNRMMASNQSPRTNSEQPHNILHSPTATESSKYYIDQILEQERRIGTRDSPPTVNAAPKQSITTTYIPPPHLPIADSDDSEDDGHELELDPLGAARM